ncbi:MutS-related protein [Phocaeicola sp.]
MELKTQYQERIDEAEKELQQVKNKILRISTLRVLLFLAGIFGVIYFYSAGGGIITLVIALTFVPFLALVKYHNRLFLRKDWLETCMKVNQDEISALNDNYDPFDGGKEFIDPAHRYSFDLDIFGHHSLFQALNRTCTSFGKKKLAEWLQHPLESKERIEQRQAAVKELATFFDFREQFRITGLLYKGATSDREEIKEWTEAPPYFSRKGWSRPVLWLIPSVNIILLALGLAGVISLNIFGVVFGVFVVASFGLIKPVSNLQRVYDKKLRILSIYAELISLIEKQEMQAPLLRQLKKEFGMNGKLTTSILKELSRELERLDLRNNQMLYVLLEGSLFWQLRQVMRIEQWRQKYGANLLHWLDTLGDVDALCSLAAFAYNHPGYVYPVIAQKPFVFHAENMGHPLMPARKCVSNDADIPSRPFFVIITGANMAGKSTYLRTIGVNYVLACIGSPVCCSLLNIYPAKLVTSLRTSDSLTDNESYFFAELKRLKQIIDRLNEGEELFIILDEILKGTNSMDKQKGSFALVRQLMTLKANGIIATHDLLLGKLIEYFPKEIRNYCFEADITNDELTFSYKLREGVAQNMNACFLMKKMGLIIDDQPHPNNLSH